MTDPFKGTDLDKITSTLTSCKIKYNVYGDESKEFVAAHSDEESMFMLVIRDAGIPYPLRAFIDGWKAHLHFNGSGHLTDMHILRYLP